MSNLFFRNLYKLKDRFSLVLWNSCTSNLDIFLPKISVILSFEFVYASSRFANRFDSKNSFIAGYCFLSKFHRIHPHKINIIQVCIVLCFADQKYLKTSIWYNNHKLEKIEDQINKYIILALCYHNFRLRI